MDVQFEKDGFRFNVRSSCILKDKLHKKVLLTNMRAITDHEVFLLPGGRLNVMENSSEAILREINEELGLNLEYKLISIEENIAKDIKFHMIEFVYYAEVDDFANIKTFDDGWDKFKLFDIDKISKVDIRPQTVINLIKQERYERVSHNINYDWL